MRPNNIRARHKITSDEIKKMAIRVSKDTSRKLHEKAIRWLIPWPKGIFQKGRNSCLKIEEVNMQALRIFSNFGSFRKP